MLLDGSFIDALLSPDSVAHESAKLIYAELIESYLDGRDLLYALSTVLDDVDQSTRRNALGPLLVVHVATQHRTAAEGVVGVDDPADALTIVMLQRERIRTIATASDSWDGFDLEVLKAGPDAETADVSSRTEPMPAPPPMGE